MAQTKTKAKKTNSSKSRSSAKKPASRSSSKVGKSKAGGAKAKAAAAVDKVEKTVERTVHSSNGHVASKAKVPLLAGGAVIAGTVGGVLLGASQSGRKVFGVNLPHPKRMQVKLKSRDFANAAKDVGRFGENVGELATELKRAREGLAGDGKHASPIEVLLRGLSHRR
jgi:hypothetical protein